MFAAEQPENWYRNGFMGTAAKRSSCFLTVPLTQHSGWLLFRMLIHVIAAQSLSPLMLEMQTNHQTQAAQIRVRALTYASLGRSVSANWLTVSPTVGL